MHPEIRKYFEEYGRIIPLYKGAQPISYWQETNGFYNTVALPHDDEWWYYIGNKWYSEPESLKVIRLTAWI